MRRMKGDKEGERKKGERATGPSGHRGPGLGELLVGFWREFFEAGILAPGRPWREPLLRSVSAGQRNM